mgnify:CR=1 FL=1
MDRAPKSESKLHRDSQDIKDVDLNQIEASVNGSQPDADGTVYRTKHDMTKNGLTVTIAMALNEVTDLDETNLIQEFSKYAEPDALDRLFRVTEGREPRKSGYIQLEIEGYTVRVNSDGEIQIEE